MKRVATLAALAAVALAAGPANAQTPVTGSGSLNEAPVLTPGTYTDTILPGEVLFYGVKVEEGQRIALQARSSMDAQRFRELVSLLRFQALGPLREAVSFDAEADVRDGGGSVGFEAGPAAEATGDPYLGPGTWYISVHAFWGRGDAPPKAEIPFEFAIEVAGAEGSAGTPTPTPTPTATPTPAPTPAPRTDPADEALDPAAIGAVGMSGLIIGLLGGAAAGRRRR